MAKRFKVQYDMEPVITQSRIVASGAVGTIDQGAPTKQGTAGVAAVMVDGDGTTSQIFTGIAKTVSTDTVAANGTVQLILPMPALVYAGFSKSAAAADTQAEIDALQGKRVVFDLTTGDWTVDTAAADNAANGVVIMGGDYRTNTIFFIVKTATSVYGE